VIARQQAWHTGKGRVRHKCPHGIWCSGGMPRTCANNISRSCKLCSAETRRQDEEASAALMKKLAEQPRTP
jgi:hypothetical protein